MKYIILLSLCVLSSAFKNKNMCYEEPKTCNASCKHHIHFEEVYTKERIKCSKNIECPKTIVVMASNVTANTTFTFIPTETDQDLDFKLEIFWCSEDSFDKSETYVRVRSHVYNEVDFILLLISGFVFVIITSLAPSNESIFLFMLLSNNNKRRRSYSRW